MTDFLPLGDFSCLQHFHKKLAPCGTDGRLLLRAQVLPSSKPRDTKTTRDIKNPAGTKFRYCPLVQEISSHLPTPMENGGGEQILKMEEFLTFNAMWPWPCIGPCGTPSCITHQPLPTHQISLELENLFVDERKYIQKKRQRHWGRLQHTCMQHNTFFVQPADVSGEVRSVPKE